MEVQGMGICGESSHFLILLSTGRSKHCQLVYLASLNLKVLVPHRASTTMGSPLMFGNGGLACIHLKFVLCHSIITYDHTMILILYII